MTNPSEESQRAHEHAGRRVTKVVRNEKINMENNLAGMARHNQTPLYAYANQRRVVRDSIGPIWNSAGAPIVRDWHARYTQGLFHLLIQNDDTNNFQEVELYEELQPFENLNLSVDEV